MIRRHHQHKLVAIFGERAQAGQRDDGGRVAARRLEQRPAALEIDAGKVGMDALGVALRGDQEDRCLAVRPRRQPTQRPGQHRAIAGKIVELLGVVLARQRPQPRPYAATHDETDDALRQDSELQAAAGPVLAGSWSVAQGWNSPLTNCLDPLPAQPARRKPTKCDRSAAIAACSIEKRRL